MLVKIYHFTLFIAAHLSFNIGTRLINYMKDHLVVLFKKLLYYCSPPPENLNHTKYTKTQFLIQLPVYIRKKDQLKD